MKRIKWDKGIKSYWGGGGCCRWGVRKGFSWSGDMIGVKVLVRLVLRFRVLGRVFVSVKVARW